MKLRRGSPFIRHALATVVAGLVLFSQPLVPVTFAGEIEEVCGGATDPTIAGQKDQYCKAAEAARKAADADNIVWKLYAATAAVCTAACVQALGLNPTQYNWCMYTTVGTAMADAYLTKQYQAAMGSLIGPAAGFLTASDPKEVPKLDSSGNPIMGPDGTPLTETVHERKEAIGPCLSAATAAVQTFVRKANVNQQEKVYGDSLESVMRLQSEAAANRNSGGQLAGWTGNSVSGGVTRAVTGGPVAGGGYGAALTGSASSCTRDSGTAQRIQCAIGADSNLPTSLVDPRFEDEFKKIAKTDLGSFLNSKGDAAETLSAAMAGALPDPSKVSDLASLNKQFESKMISEGAGTAYASGGGASRGSASKDDDFGSMISGLMSQFMPGQGGNTQHMSGVQEVHFLTKTRGPASVAEAKNLSIFDRVSYRYLYVQAQFFGVRNLSNSGVRK